LYVANAIKDKCNASYILADHNEIELENITIIENNVISGAVNGKAIY